MLPYPNALLPTSDPKPYVPTGDLIFVVVPPVLDANDSAEMTHEVETVLGDLLDISPDAWSETCEVETGSTVLIGTAVHPAGRAAVSTALLRVQERYNTEGSIFWVHGPIRGLR